MTSQTASVIPASEAPPRANAPDHAGTRLPLWQCWGFGVGSFGIALLLNTVTIFFPTFMTTVLGQSAALAGLLLTLSKLYDAVADVGIGSISDRTKSRWGRRRPYMLAGAAISGLSFLLIFIPPDWTGASLTAWMLIGLIVYSTGYSLFSVPYIAMAGEMTDSYHERTRLMSFRAFFIALGQVVSAAGTAALVAWFGGGTGGYAMMGAIIGATLTISMIVSIWMTKDARQAQHVASHTFTRTEAAKAILANKPFILLMTIKLAQYMAIAIITTTKLLFLLNVLKLGYGGLAQLTLVQNLVSAATVPLWVIAAKKIGKRTAYLLSTALLAMVYASWYFAEPGIAMSEVWLRGAINGVAAAGTTLMSISMLPDVMEYDRIRTGLRREGLFSGFYTIIEKLGFALGAGLIGLLLSMAGYIPSFAGKLVTQPQSAIDALYYGSSLIPAGLAVLSCCLMLAYSLDDRKLKAMAAGAR